MIALVLIDQWRIGTVENTSRGGQPQPYSNKTALPPIFFEDDTVRYESQLQAKFVAVGPIFPLHWLNECDIFILKQNSSQYFWRGGGPII